jgi:hypothetical protein
MASGSRRVASRLQKQVSKRIDSIPILTTGILYYLFGRFLHLGPNRLGHIPVEYPLDIRWVLTATGLQFMQQFPSVRFAFEVSGLQVCLLDHLLTAVYCLALSAERV